jgi:hypothetical protein
MRTVNDDAWQLIKQLATLNEDDQSPDFFKKLNYAVEEAARLLEARGPEVAELQETARLYETKPRPKSLPSAGPISGDHTGQDPAEAEREVAERYKPKAKPQLIVMPPGTTAWVSRQLSSDAQERPRLMHGEEYEPEDGV